MSLKSTSQAEEIIELKKLLRNYKVMIYIFLIVSGSINCVSAVFITLLLMREL